MSDRFLKERDMYHFILVISETEYFNEYEEKYYKEIITEQEKNQMTFGLQTKVSRIIDPKTFKKLGNIKSKYNNENKNKLIEYDNTKNLTKNFVRKNYPFVSFIYGGFKEIHNYTMKLKIPLLNHEEDYCKICLENKKKLENKDGLLSRIFNWKKSNY